MIVAFFTVYKVKLRYKWLVVASLVAALVAVIAFSPLAKKKFERTKLEGLSFEQVNQLLSARLYLWETALSMAKDRPLVGVGGDAFRIAYPKYTTRDDDPFTAKGRSGPQNAHQLYLSVLAETGLIGLSGLLLIFGALVYWVVKASSSQKYDALPFAVGLLAVTFPLNSQPLIYKTWWAPLLVLFLTGLLVALAPDKNRQAH